ncbi:unnamed protein product [Closterium sp. NIES-64]|nr:unnamed protein product [Closterium sp. NIES-64]
MFNENRQKLAERMRAKLQGREEHAIVLLQGGESQMRHCTDHEDVFRQESYFSYLFGVIEPGFYGAVDVSVQPARSFLFMPHLPDSYAVWMGPLHTHQQIKDKYGVDEVHYIEDMAAVLKAAAAGSGSGLPTLFLLKGINTDSGNSCKPAHFDGIDAFPQDLTVLHPELSECRVIKSQEEIRVMRYAAAVSSDAHVEVMRRVRPGMMEYEMEADFLHHAAVVGGCRLAGYTCICGTGPNSSILHYGHAGAPNDRECRDGDMALLDMGAEYFTYGADITCSFPVNGTLTADQRLVYEAVLAAQRAVFGAMKPGVSWVDMHRLSERTILEHLKEGGLLQGSIDDMMAQHLGALFMPHGLGHFLGIDTHDVGGYNNAERLNEPGAKSLRTTRHLEAGMVITVEPGCYFIDTLLDPALADPAVARFLVPERIAHFRGFGGVRLEDDVVVTTEGIENLTKCPRDVAEVEAVMAGKPWPCALDSLQ